MPLMIELSLSISAICWSTYRCWQHRAPARHASVHGLRRRGRSVCAVPRSGVERLSCEPQAAHLLLLLAVDVEVLVRLDAQLVALRHILLVVDLPIEHRPQ